MAEMLQDQTIEPTANTVVADLEGGLAVTGVVKNGRVRTGDKTNEQVVIPKNRIFIVFIGLMLTTFLAALDQTIVCTSLAPYYQVTADANHRRCVATALPTIVHDLSGAANYAWVGTSYLLASASFTPIYGRAR